MILTVKENVRLRVNPRLCRVSIQRVDDGWRYTIAVRDEPERWVQARDRTPARAFVRALRLAEAQDFPGLNLGLGWAYDHPQYVPPKSRATR